MFNRLRALFDRKPRVGDLVTVVSGPYAGKTGTISAVAGPLSTVYIDECCQPRLPNEAVHREWRGRGIPAAFRRSRAKQSEVEIAQMLLGQHDNIDPFL